MAIQTNETGKLPDTGVEYVKITFDNGDMKALEDIKEKWNFKDRESLLKFSMAILLKADVGSIKISVSGNETIVSPRNDLLNQES